MAAVEPRSPRCLAPGSPRPARPRSRRRTRFPPADRAGLPSPCSPAMADSTSPATCRLGARKITNAATTPTNVIARFTITLCGVRPGLGTALCTTSKRPCKPPDDERPRRAVPEAAEEHRDRSRLRTVCAAPARAAERDEQVVAEPERQRHVPAPPEVRDVHRLVRRVEVLREAEAEQQREADRHVRVAGEVEVELERVAERRRPAGRRAPSVVVAREQRVDVRRELVRDQQLLRRGRRRRRTARTPPAPR